MTDFNPKSIIVFKRSTIKKLRNEFELLKTDIIENKETYENCLKLELEKNKKLKDLIRNISNNLSMFILDSENQLIYINKLLIDNQILKEENNKLKEFIKTLFVGFGIVLFISYFLFYLFTRMT